MAVIFVLAPIFSYVVISKLCSPIWLPHTSYCFLSICVFSVTLTFTIVVCLFPEFYSNCLWCVMTQIANLCKLCTKKVQSFSHYLQCANCLRKCHVRCMDMKVSDIITYPDQWYCPPCMENMYVYNHYDDNDSFHNAVIEEMLDCSSHLGID